MVSLTFEVPSGMAADLLGRRKTLVAGGVCMVLSNLLMAFAPDLFFICLAMALSALANAMFSGTASALTYDSLKQCGRTDDYLRVSANCSQLSMLATAVGSRTSRATCPASSRGWCGTASPLFAPPRWLQSSSSLPLSSASPAT